MPFDRRSALQLAVLLLAVPTQYLIMQFLSTDEVQRSVAFNKIVSTAVNIKDTYLSWAYWQEICASLLPNVGLFKSQTLELSDYVDDEESLAVEVLNYRDHHGYFASSTVPRSIRPKYLAYRVGQVVKHKQFGYRGVIIGWDLEAKAPEDWMRYSYSVDAKKYQHSPHYLILVDARDRPKIQKSYVAQENLTVLNNVKIVHPRLEEFLSAFDGAQYLLQNWLRSLYPLD